MGRPTQEDLGPTSSSAGPVGSATAPATRAVLLDALIKPFEITSKDPAVLFVQVYTAIYYSFFEIFPLVYPVYYHMNLVFLFILVCWKVFVSIH
ncbi:hypothetical protein NOR_08558 [Metarhizium rileyi]|uniref:Uncharacterized protein n=1 Tax=Metarhizium rileyi (strain RCEF 4871) TaxID=1649241 RepID=A0A166RVH7_METRR|nr:hypothetical protein NOR_08558 [Metarhizium rileyi RCEF 4871]